MSWKKPPAGKPFLTDKRNTNVTGNSKMLLLSCIDFIHLCTLVLMFTGHKNKYKNLPVSARALSVLCVHEYMRETLFYALAFQHAIQLCTIIWSIFLLFWFHSFVHFHSLGRAMIYATHPILDFSIWCLVVRSFSLSGCVFSPLEIVNTPL